MIKAIVFDLDGTLYEETAHFDYLASRIESKLPDERKLDFRRDYELSIQFEHPLQVGRIYDVKNDLILVQENEYVKEAYRWNGESVPTDQVKQLYPEKISFNHDTMVNVGDLWWVPMSISAHYGLDGQKNTEAFLETRDYMMSAQFEMQPIPGLQALLEQLQMKIPLVLLTNSPETDSEVILTKLGIEHVFHKKFFNGKKPVLTRKWFDELKTEFAIQYGEILSIGDNEINDIKPVSSLGCKTIYIDTHELGNSTSADYVVHKMSEAFSIIEKLVKGLSKKSTV